MALALRRAARSVGSFLYGFFGDDETTSVNVINAVFVNILPKVLGAIAAFTAASIALVQYCGQTSYFQQLFAVVGLGGSPCELATAILMTSNGFGLIIFFVSRALLKFVIAKIANYLATHFFPLKSINKYFTQIQPSKRQINLSYFIAGCVVSFLYVTQGASALIANGVYDMPIWPPFVWLHAIFVGWWQHDYNGDALNFIASVGAGSVAAVSCFLIIHILVLPAVFLAFNAVHRHFYPPQPSRHAANETPEAVVTHQSSDFNATTVALVATPATTTTIAAANEVTAATESNGNQAPVLLSVFATEKRSPPKKSDTLLIGDEHENRAVNHR